jgi:hypothetical protein
VHLLQQRTHPSTLLPIYTVQDVLDVAELPGRVVAYVSRHARAGHVQGVYLQTGFAGYRDGGGRLKIELQEQDRARTANGNPFVVPHQLNYKVRCRD